MIMSAQRRLSGVGLRRRLRQPLRGMGASGYSPFTEPTLTDYWWAEEGVGLSGFDVISWIVGVIVEVFTSVNPTDPVYNATAMGGRPGIVFSNAADSYVYENAYAPHTGTQHTFIAAVDVTTATGDRTIFDTQTGRLLFGIHGGNWAIYDGAWRDIAAASAGLQTASLVCNGTSAEIFINGSSIGTATITARAISGSAGIFSRWNGGGLASFDGVAGWLGVLQTVSATVRGNVESYWANYYGI